MDAKAVSALNRQIAEKLGYYVYHYDKDIAANCYFELMDPDGNPVRIGYSDGEQKTEAEAWATCPNWEGDIHRAIELLEGRRYKIECGPDLTQIRVMFYTETGFVDAIDHPLETAIAQAFVKLDLEAEDRQRRLEDLRAQQRQLAEEIAQLESERPPKPIPSENPPARSA